MSICAFLEKTIYILLLLKQFPGLQGGDNVVDSLTSDTDRLQESVNGVNEGASQLQISFYALVAWILIVTLVLVIIAIITYHRWQSNDFGDGLESSARSSIYSSISNYLSGGISRTEAEKDVVRDIQDDGEPDAMIDIDLSDDAGISDNTATAATVDKVVGC